MATAGQEKEVTDTFHKFPHTPHLVWLGSDSPREDKLLSTGEARAFLAAPVVIEEKVDGANCGLSVGADGRIRAQSRGNYLAPGRSHAQWNPLWPWLAQREQTLATTLGENLMLFGEWTYALHTIAYTALPDWFLVFDVYEIDSGRFWSSDRRNVFVGSLGLKTIPELHRGRLSLNQAEGLIGPSKLGMHRMEGIYLRHEKDGCLVQRAKVVSAAFKQQIEAHWTRRALVTNRLQSTQEALS